VVRKAPGYKTGRAGQGVSFRWKEDGDPDGLTVWAIFKKDTDYFKPCTQPFLLNFRAENLDELMEALLA
jgi:hypothetical protein